MVKFDFSKKTEAQLREMIGGMTPGTDCRVAGEMALAKLLRRREFWKRDVVSWAALVIALISLILHIAERC